MNIQTIKPPEHAGSREQASELTQSLAEDLTGQTVRLDCSDIVVCTPSFLDELVKQILEQRRAALLEVLSASDRAHHLLVRAATNRDVDERLVFAVVGAS